MSKLRQFVEGAGQVASIQEGILNAMEDMFAEEEYASLEAAILAPGYEDWESRAISLIKSSVNDRWTSLHAHCAILTERYKTSVPYPNQSSEFWVDTLNKPHLRAYWCLKCGFKVTSMALSGICCHGQPKCSRCGHEVHEENCRRNAPKVGN